jgi:hypothetical protein
LEGDDKKPPTDVALIHGKTPDGEGLHIIRRREDRIELGAARPLKQGAPIHGEVVTLTPRKDAPWLCDVKVEFDGRSEAAREGRSASAGPPKVASDDYRRNWDLIWKRDETDAVN